MKNNKFLKSFAILASGTLLAQLVTALASPVMTRLFSTTEIGQYTYILSIINLFYPVVALRYDYMIVPEKKDSRVFALLKLSFSLLTFFSVVIGIGYFAFNFNKDNVIVISVMLVLMMISNGFVDIIGNYNNKYGQYKLMSSTYAFRSIVQNILMIIAGFLHLGIIGLIASQLIGSFAGLSRQSKDIITRRKDIWEVGLDEVKNVAVKYKAQALLSTPAIFMNSFSYNALNFAISFAFGNSILGLYSLSYRILGMPVTLISGNLSKVYFEEAANEYKETGCFKKSFNTIVKYTLPIAICVLLGLVILAPMVFSIVFGSNWREAGVMAQILAPMFSIRIVANTLGPSIWITQKQKYDVIFQVLLVLGLGITVVSKFLLDITVYEFLGVYCISNSMVYLYSIYVHYQLSRGKL